MQINLHKAYDFIKPIEKLVKKHDLRRADLMHFDAQLLHLFIISAFLNEINLNFKAWFTQSNDKG